MVEVRLRPTAKGDLQDIALYSREQWSEDQAERYIDQIMDVIEQIADYPYSGRDMSETRPGYRRRVAGHHLVVYAIMPDGAVEIARILHEKVDVDRHLEGGSP